MSTANGGADGERTRKRELPEWMYAEPDERNKIIAEAAEILEQVIEPYLAERAVEWFQKHGIARPEE